MIPLCLKSTRFDRRKEKEEGKTIHRSIAPGVESGGFPFPARKPRSINGRINEAGCMIFRDVILHGNVGFAQPRIRPYQNSALSNPDFLSDLSIPLLQWPNYKTWARLETEGRNWGEVKKIEGWFLSNFHVERCLYVLNLIIPWSTFAKMYPTLLLGIFRRMEGALLIRHNPSPLVSSWSSLLGGHGHP